MILFIEKICNACQEKFHAIVEKKANVFTQVWQFLHAHLAVSQNLSIQTFETLIFQLRICEKLWQTIEMDRR